MQTPDSTIPLSPFPSTGSGRKPVVPPRVDANPVLMPTQALPGLRPGIGRPHPLKELSGRARTGSGQEGGNKGRNRGTPLRRCSGQAPRPRQRGRAPLHTPFGAISDVLADFVCKAPPAGRDMWFSSSSSLSEGSFSELGMWQSTGGIRPFDFAQGGNKRRSSG